MSSPAQLHPSRIQGSPAPLPKLGVGGSFFLQGNFGALQNPGK